MKQLVSSAVGIFALVLVSLCPVQAFATTQEQDIIVVDGAIYYTYNLPSLAECLPNVSIPEFQMLHTANYKGYRATWAVINKQLFLIGVEGKIHETEGKRMHTTSELFPQVYFPHKVTSFSGTIELEGRHLDYIVNADLITYTDKLVLHFTDGLLINTEKTTHDKKTK